MELKNFQNPIQKVKLLKDKSLCLEPALDEYFRCGLNHRIGKSLNLDAFSIKNLKKMLYKCFLSFWLLNSYDDLPKEFNVWTK